VTRHDWDNLPAGVQHAVERECGSVAKSVTATTGANSDFASTLQTEKGRFFCKGVLLDDPKVRMHRHEERVNPWLPAVAPRIVWRVETDGWLLLGFEHVSGQHANLSPDSPDVALVAEALSVLSTQLTPCPPIEAGDLSHQWQRFSPWSRIAQSGRDRLSRWALSNLERLIYWESRAVEYVRGDTLCHTDIQAENLLVGERLSIIDWAWARRGAAWVDTAFAAIRLVDSGHSTSQAEQWAAQIPVWRAATEEAVTAFTVAVAGMWEHRTQQDPQPFRQALTATVTRWAAERLG
jgi:hypothetical protein